MQKKYVMTISEDSEGTLRMQRENTGFSVFELLGFFYHCLSSLKQQARTIESGEIASTLIANIAEEAHEINE